MSWDTERSVAGKKPFNFIAIELQRCTNTWGDGVGTSPATGCPAVLGVDADDKCHNSWQTCPVRDSFAPASYWINLCEANADIPRDFNFADVSPPDDCLPAFLPLLASHSHDPWAPDPGETMGVRVRFEAKCKDAPHHDIGIDKYALERVTGVASSEEQSYLSLPGVNGEFASTPDSAAASITGDIDIIVKVAAADYTPAAVQRILSKWALEGNQSYFLTLTTSGLLQLRWTADGSTDIARNSTVSLGTADGSQLWIRATLDADNGSAQHVVNFYTSTDYDPDTRAGTWTQLGATVTTAGTTSIFDGTASVLISGDNNGTAAPFAGKVYYAEIRASGNGPAAVVFDPRGVPSDTRDFSSRTGQAWKVNGTVAKIVACPGAFNPVERGSFWRKLKARFPFYVGRRIRWYQGYISSSPSLADFQRREYIIEKLTGPDARGMVQVTANDVLRMLDGKRSQCPAKSTGTLSGDMAEGASITTIDVLTEDDTEYDLKAGETEDYVRIGSEVFTYTGTTPITDGVQLTGVTRAAPDPYTTQVDGHEDGDDVQRCRFLSGRVPEVVAELMVDYAGVPSYYIPTADWDAEADDWAQDEIERLVTAPEGVEDLVNEIIGQTLTWGFWFDEIDNEIKYRAVRPADDEDVPELTDDEHIIAGSVQLRDLADQIINEVQVLFGQIDPTKSKDDFDNYRCGHAQIQADSQSSFETGQRRIKKEWGRWHPAQNASVVEAFAIRTINARSKNLFEVQFALERKDEAVRSSQFCDLSTIYLIDALGAPETTRVQILRVKADGEEVTYRAREDFFREQYGRLAPEGSPDGIEGLLWDDATEAQRTRYFFLADTDGYFTNGDRGKALA